MPVTIDAIRAKLVNLTNTPPPRSTHNIQFYASSIDAYNTKVLSELNTIVENTTDPAGLVLSLQAFLAENWTMINGTGLGYTAQPDSPVTDLLCDIASFVAQERHTNILNVLMPTVCVESIDRRYPNLEPKDEIAIKAILRTHILGQQGNYLIPVKYLTDYDIQSGFKSIVNPYYDIFTHNPSMVALPPEEVNRLVEHSRFTREVYDAQQAFESCANDQETLLGQLRLLVSHLNYNSVNGVGTETAAGTASATAIFNFMAYYDSLGDALKQVPQEVKTQIQIIKDYSSDRSKNTTISSCMALRRSALVSSMSAHLDILAVIRPSDETRQSLVVEARTRLVTARTQLLQSLGQGNSGFDKAAIPHRLVEQLNVRVVFDNYRDLEVFKFLSSEEIEAFCSNDNYKRSIVYAIYSLENLVLLSHQLSPERLAVLLRGLEPLLREGYLGNWKDFASALMTLDKERRDVYWEQYKHYLKEALSSCNYWEHQLDFRINNEVYHLDLSLFSGVPTGYDSVSLVFSLLAEPQQSELYESTKHLWRQKLSSVSELADMIKYFKPAWRREVFALFRDAQIEQVKPGDFLSKNQMVRLYASIERKMNAMKSTGADFRSEFIRAFLWELAKISVLPGIKKYGFSRYESSSAFFNTVAFPVVCCGFSLAAACMVVGLAINGIAKLLRGEFQDGANYILGSASMLCITAVLAAVTALVTVLTIPAIAIRSTVTAGSYLLGGYADQKSAEDIGGSSGPHAAAML